jgi:hypothetical protein
MTIRDSRTKYLSKLPLKDYKQAISLAFKNSIALIIEMQRLS